MNGDNLREGWPATCDTCRGVGLVGGHGDQRTCPDCKGTGLPANPGAARDAEYHRFEDDDA